MLSEHEIRRKTQIRVARKIARSGSPVLTGSSSLTIIHRNCAAQVAYQSCALQSKNVLMDGQSARHESEGRRHMHWMYLRLTGCHVQMRACMRAHVLFAVNFTANNQLVKHPKFAHVRLTPVQPTKIYHALAGNGRALHAGATPAKGRLAVYFY